MNDKDRYVQERSHRHRCPAKLHASTVIDKRRQFVPEDSGKRWYTCYGRMEGLDGYGQIHTPDSVRNCGSSQCREDE